MKMKSQLQITSSISTIIIVTIVHMFGKMQRVLQQQQQKIVKIKAHKILTSIGEISTKVHSVGWRVLHQT